MCKSFAWFSWVRNSCDVAWISANNKCLLVFWWAFSPDWAISTQHISHRTLGAGFRDFLGFWHIWERSYCWIIFSNSSGEYLSIFWFFFKQGFILSKQENDKINFYKGTIRPQTITDEWIIIVSLIWTSEPFLTEGLFHIKKRVCDKIVFQRITLAKVRIYCVQIRGWFWL